MYPAPPRIPSAKDFKKCFKKMATKYSVVFEAKSDG